MMLQSYLMWSNDSDTEFGSFNPTTRGIRVTTKTIRRKYTDDLKGEAVALVTEQGYGVSQAARRLRVNAKLNYKRK